MPVIKCKINEQKEKGKMIIIRKKRSRAAVRYLWSKIQNKAHRKRIGGL